jgi:hypothetical protein
MLSKEILSLGAENWWDKQYSEVDTIPFRAKLNGPFIYPEGKNWASRPLK